MLHLVLFAVLLLQGPSAPVTPIGMSADTVRQDSAWVRHQGDSTIYGHTTTTTVTTVARSSASQVDSVRVAPPSIALGLTVGLSRWPVSAYCSGPMSGSVEPLEPTDMLARVQVAARCGMRLVLVPPRRRYTVNGQTAGAFSIDQAKHLTDAVALALPPDTLAKYRGTIVGFNLGDDYACRECWGGQAITQTQIAAWAAYTRTKLPGLPLGVRVTPDWVATLPGMAPLLDYAWAQYHTGKGPQLAYYSRADSIARALGLRMVIGINAEDCTGMATEPCSAAELVRYGTVAAQFPGSCAFLSFAYTPATWARPEIRTAWAALVAVAKTQPARDCHR